MTLKVDDLSEEQHALWFSVRRSGRYHDRRLNFFTRLHQITGGLTVLLSGSVIFDVARPGNSPWWLLTIAFVLACLAAWDIVVGYSSLANMHRELKRRWADLEIKLIQGDRDEATWKAYHIERLVIEKDEPPIYKALDVLCHQDLMIADGYCQTSESMGLKVSRWQRLTSQIIHWSNIANSQTGNATPEADHGTASP